MTICLLFATYWTLKANTKKMYPYVLFIEDICIQMYVRVRNVGFIKGIYL